MAPRMEIEEAPAPVLYQILLAQAKALLRREREVEELDQEVANLNTRVTELEDAFGSLSRTVSRSARESAVAA